jgi:hypothetical protein
VQERVSAEPKIEGESGKGEGGKGGRASEPGHLAPLSPCITCSRAHTDSTRSPRRLIPVALPRRRTLRRLAVPSPASDNLEKYRAVFLEPEEVGKGKEEGGKTMR